MKYFSEIVEIKAAGKYLPLVFFATMCKVSLLVEPANAILCCYNSNESYITAVLFAAMYKLGLNFSVEG